MARRLDIRLLGARFALARLPYGAPPPEISEGPLSVVIRSPEGVSIVCLESAVPMGAESGAGYRCLEVAGALELESVGVVAAITHPIAEAGVSLFAYSTWLTDYLLVHESDLDRALAACRAVGHRVLEE